MCIFSGDIDQVANTRIFARRDGERQWLAYEMQVTLQADLAMILPLPTPPGVGEDAVEFVDLSAYPRLFDDLNGLYPTPAAPTASQSAPAFSQGTLVVHRVGAFVASFVPTQADFARLDPRFRLPEDVWDALPQYRDHSFAVFALSAPTRPRGWLERLGLRRVETEDEPQQIHPMVLSYPHRHPTDLTFPTLHVHHGFVPAREWFDHELYFQTDDDEPPGVRSAYPARARLQTDRCRGLVQPDQHVYRLSRSGEHPNEDVVVTRA